MRKPYADYRKELSDLIRVAQAAGEIKAELNAEAIVAMLIGAIDWLVFNTGCPELDACRWIRSFLSALFGGVAQQNESDQISKGGPK